MHRARLAQPIDRLVQLHHGLSTLAQLQLRPVEGEVIQGDGQPT